MFAFVAGCHGVAVVPTILCFLLTFRTPPNTNPSCENVATRDARGTETSDEQVATENTVECDTKSMAWVAITVLFDSAYTATAAAVVSVCQVLIVLVGRAEFAEIAGVQGGTGGCVRSSTTGTLLAAQPQPAAVLRRDHHPRDDGELPGRAAVPRLLLADRIRRHTQHGQDEVQCRTPRASRRVRATRGRRRPPHPRPLQRRLERQPAVVVHTAAKGSPRTARRDGPRVLHGNKPQQGRHYRNRHLQRDSKQREKMNSHLETILH